MISKLSIRKRLVLFGALWLTACTVLLAFHLFSEGRRTLLEGAVKRSQTVAGRLAEQARGPLYAGDDTALQEILEEIEGQPDILSAAIRLGDKNYRSKAIRIESTDAPEKIVSGASRLVTADGLRAVESHASIQFQGEALTDGIPFRTERERRENGQAVVLLSVEPVFAQVQTLLVRTALILGGVLGAGLLLGWALFGAMVSPLRRMADHARRLADGDAAGERGLPSEDEIAMVLSLMASMKRSLDEKTDRIVELQRHLKDSVNKRSDLEEMNTLLSDVLNQRNDFLRLLSHEVKTPLGTVSNLIAGLQDGVPGPVTDRQKEYLALIKSNTDRVNRVIAAMLQHAVARTGHVQIDRCPVRVSDVVRQVCFALLAFQEERQVACILGDSVFGKTVQADMVLVDQILFNLIHNAIKASPPGGAVTLEATETGSEVVIGVRDAGMGIPKEIQPKLLLEPLSSDVKKGGGVGLYISRYLVELHGGRIWYTAEEGKGTAFYFTLPNSPAHVEKRV
ncbi:sensor histidine kinase [Candidatus Manganitrophus noduliformans]|uniref:histidine kinase n=1 Tax=Candidatus Manganitrophus noduliformans TaxID=2606439 RepID=A0A7X6DMU4_9BACT|nr:HAMP domain-containing sensor histidine kinase [Candidatus Manganitrophus noduliformans]NKE70138.1 HAMP domain-containing histidine kinase [Candidatus Manganitrophus noduliformans]